MESKSISNFLIFSLKENNLLFNSQIGSGLDWRTKLDMQRGAVLAAELRNNGFKLAKWTTCAILAGSDHMKFGYVSRQNFKDASRHTIIGMQNFKPQEFATQMALNMDNGWGIVRGKFILM